MCEDIADKELAIDTYHLVRLDRNRHGGGIVMYIKNNLSFYVIKSVPELEFCTINIKCFSGNTCIALAYRPPSAPPQYFDSLSNVLLDLNIHTFSNFVLIGDLNVDVSTTSFSTSTLSCIFQQFGLHLVSTSPTRTTDSTSTTIDVIACSNASSIMACDVVPQLGSSDHYGLSVSLSCGQEHNAHCTKPRRTIWHYRNADFERANNLLTNINISDIVVENDVNASWTNFASSEL